MNSRSTVAAKQPTRWWYLLLLLPFIGVLWVPFYASAQPGLFGIPYFYWYQFLWILISAVLTALVYFATREPEGDEPIGEALSREDLP